MMMKTVQDMEQAMVQDLTPLESGFRRYEDYVTYGDKHDVLEQHFKERIPELLANRRKLRMLDIGAGMGRLTKLFVHLSERLAIKAEINVLEPSHRARVRFEETLGGDLQYVNLRPQHFTIGAPLDPEPYDLILAAHVCYYFEDKSVFVQQMMNSLSQDGIAIVVATSISILQNPIYQTILARLRSREDLPRTFASDGKMGFAEEIEYALFDQNIVYTRDVLLSHVSFSPVEMARELDVLVTSNGVLAGPLLKVIAFLWQYETASLLTETVAWQKLFKDYVERQIPLIIDYADIVLYAIKGVPHTNRNISKGDLLL